MDDYFLRSRRLGYRCWRDTDLPLAINLWGDPTVTRYITSRSYTLREVQIRLQLEIDAQHAHSIQYWPIFLLATDAHVGCCGLRVRESQPEIPELGVHIVSRHWRQGYAFEAASRVIEHAFTALGVQAVFAGHNPENVASQGLLVKLGFVHTHDEFYEPTGLEHPSYLLTHPKHAAG